MHSIAGLDYSPCEHTQLFTHKRFSHDCTMSSSYDYDFQYGSWLARAELGQICMLVVITKQRAHKIPPVFT